MGSSQPRVGTPFGNLYEPEHFGCRGGGGGGLGGGVIRMHVTNRLKVDGTLSCNGSPGVQSSSGGGSGGSIWIETNLVLGYGSMQVNGGDGKEGPGTRYYHGGGGAGGRIAVYFKSNRTYSGTFEAYGGNSAGNGGTAGGAGTIFLYHLVHRHRTLVVSNKDRTPLKPRDQPIASYSDLSLVPGTAWLLTESGEHRFAKDMNYHFEELQIYGGAHVAVHELLGNTSASLRFRHMIGDRSGTVHVGTNQLMDLNRSEIDLPFNVHVYQGAYLGLAPETIVHGVALHVHGVIENIQDLLLHHAGVLYLNEGSRTGNTHFKDNFR